jgi:4-hydroxy-tetrahydrodipicolinate synthase
MLAHFRTIAHSVGIPIILHDVPSRTVCGLADATIARLAERSRFIALKDATGDVTRPLRNGDVRPKVILEWMSPPRDKRQPKNKPRPLR